MSKVKGDDAAERFQVWASSHPLSYFREIANRNRTQLVRTIILDAVGIDRPALRQNSRIQLLLKNLEDHLRAEGVLVGDPIVSTASTDTGIKHAVRPKSTVASFSDAERLARLEKEVSAKDAELADLRSTRGENKKLKKMLHDLQSELSQFKALDEVLRESGRLPR